jgi:hypothetical protein
MFMERGTTMKRSLLTALALLLILFSATVCEASDARPERHQRVGNQMFYNFNDGMYGASARKGNMRFHNFSVEISGDPTRIENMEFDDVDDGASGAFAKIGGMILYNFDW